jgi:hypothetical protein
VVPPSLCDTGGGDSGSRDSGAVDGHAGRLSGRDRLRHRLVDQPVLAVVGFEVAIGKSHQVFMSVVFGGMGIRMALVLIAFTILLLNGYHPLAMALSLMGFYLIVLTAEVMYALQVLAGRKVKLEEAVEEIDENGTLGTTSLQYASN